MQIDVFHDTACPWCRIGKAHLKQALAQWDGEPVEIQYHTFFLNPTIPPEGYNFRDYMSAKGGGRVPIEQWFAEPRDAGQRAGVTFNFEKIMAAPNTTLSHQLIALAPPPQQEALMDAIYAAYFEHGQNIGDADVLVAIAEKHGMDGVDVRQQLENNTTRTAVLAAYQQAQQLGVTGVPFFVFNGRLALSGAHPPETILQVMHQAIENEPEER